MDYAAIILSGGRGSRLGYLRKDLIKVHGHTLLQRAVTATQDALARVVVGPEAPEEEPELVHIWEEPHYAGPAAAVAAGWQLLRQQVPAQVPVVILGVDLAHPEAILNQLLRYWAAAEAEQQTADARPLQLLLPQDEAGKDQYVASAMRAGALSAAIDALHAPRGGLADAPLKRIFAGIEPAQRSSPVLAAGVLQDIDTSEDAAELAAELPEEKTASD